MSPNEDSPFKGTGYIKSSALGNCLTDSEGREDLVYIKTEDGSYRGWRVDLLIGKLSSKMEEKILLCSSCNGMLRDACFYEGDLRCGVCIPEGVAWQPVKMNREIVSDKMISCPLKKRGCEWSDTVSTVIHHLEECEFFPVLCLSRRREEGESYEAGEDTDSRTPERLVSIKRTVPCPNECVIEGEETTRQLKRRDVPVHLANGCPLQKVECPYWVYGCREEMERK
ncbi:TNF receptor-associated factor 4 [Oopsacas minuta]|uniref:TNF receptor-associated factor 4 n=1 Tax=Oopsacas minuta TaxID=111878 RepID=A0AAV7K4W3_9METZ|nr:TNF receptor-associated factor 4 [Oopsacas minuta]